MVWAGRRPGIYNTWAECQEQTNQYVDAKYKSFSSKKEAEQAFHDGWKKHWGQKSAAKPVHRITSYNVCYTKLLRKMNNLYNESILVCVYYGPNGERLIKRGCKIANMLQAPLYILTIDPKPFDELDAEKVFYIEQWKKFANSHESAQFIIKDNESSYNFV